MADTKISNLTELTVPPDPTDELVVVDKSDTTMAASGTDKRIQYSNLYDWAEAGDLSVIEPDDAAAAGTSVEHARADHQHAIDCAVASTISGTNAEGSATSFARSDHNHALPVWGTTTVLGGVMGNLANQATGATNTWYAVVIRLLTAGTLTGITYFVGTTSNGNVKSALYSTVGTKLAHSDATTLGQGTASTAQRIPFDATYDALPGLYYGLVWFTSATATTMAGLFNTAASTGTNATTTPTGIGAPGFSATALRPSISTY